MKPDLSYARRGAACLSCVRADQLVHVAAAVRQEQAVYHVRGIAADSFGHPVAVRARATRTGPLAAALGPPRRRRASKLAAAVVIVIGIGSAMNMIAAIAAADAGGFLGAAAGACLAACGAWWIIRRRRDASASAVVINRARWLWRRCWYCRRCGLVSLLMPSGSTTLPAAKLGSALVALAQRLTWRPSTARPGATDRGASTAA